MYNKMRRELLVFLLITHRYNSFYNQEWADVSSTWTPWQQIWSICSIEGLASAANDTCCYHVGQHTPNSRLTVNIRVIFHCSPTKRSRQIFWTNPLIQ